MENNTYDAIVIGSGMSGGWAAKELSEQGLKTLVLERGRDVKHIKDYPTAFKNPWDFKHRGQIPRAEKEANPIVSRCYAFSEATEHFFVKDNVQPYIQEKPFDWIRGYHVGGKSLLWARQVQRWSKFEFEQPLRDNYAVDWPIRYDDLADWYSHVEKFVGISGNKDGVETIPDGEFLPPWEINVVEKHIQKSIKDNYKDRFPIIGRCAHLTEPKEIHLEQGRGKCQARTLCYRGCPFGGYFSANASTIPWAEKTGNMTLRTNAIVHSIIYDEQQKKATGVRVIDRFTKETTEYFAKVIFLNASTINSNLILLNSKSNKFPNGLGNDNGLLGKYISFHIYRGRISATYDGFEDSYYYGRRPTQILMPNFRNVRKQDMAFKGGYMIHYSALRKSWNREVEGDQIGIEFKDKISKPGQWDISMMAQIEKIPEKEDHVRLSEDQTDEWGIPQVIASVGYNENDDLLLQDFHEQGSEMLKKAGCKNIKTIDSQQAPGLDIHEVGGVRMGVDPKTSLLNKWNQLHACKNVFVTDGACMTSTGTQNPSLTFMAITARAASFAVKEIKKGNL